MAWEGQPQRGLEPTNLPITSRLRYLLRHWGIGFAQYGRGTMGRCHPAFATFYPKSSGRST